MEQKKLTRGCAYVLLIYLGLACAFFWICGDQLRFRDAETEMLSNSGIVGEITSDTVIEQPIHTESSVLKGIMLYAATFQRENTGRLIVDVCSGDRVLGSYTVDISSLADNACFYVPLDIPLQPEQNITLSISAPDSSPGNAVTLYYGSTIQTGRAELDAPLHEEDYVCVNGERLNGVLCMELHTRAYLWFGSHYWSFVGVLFLVLLLCLVMLLRNNKRGRASPVLNVLAAFSRYRYLIAQLVTRDFKTKYKRSVLGVFWSFLNPLLTMSVQYVVFSTLFRSNIPNFALYLLIGIVCFSFFSEATSMALTSIVGNAALITKVYVPKFIFPLSRVISSSVNFLLALIPLFAVMLITGTSVQWSILLLPLGILCLFQLSLGIGLVLASSMVFFRDTQFLWGVLSMLWMYATPIFYPESILPENLLPMFKCNPLYHIIRFIRILLMDGVSPEPKAYLLMLAASLIPLLFGMLVFKKTQDRFVLIL